MRLLSVKNFLISLVSLAAGWWYYQSVASQTRVDWINRELGQKNNQLVFLNHENLDLAEQIQTLEATISGLQAVAAAPSAPASNTPPGSGFSRQSVLTDVGSFTVSLIAADLNSTRVIVDTASDGDCSDNCPGNVFGRLCDSFRGICRGQRCVFLPGIIPKLCR